MQVARPRKERAREEPRPASRPAEIHGARALLDGLLARGVDTVFLVPGAQILPLVTELSTREEPRAVCAAHELGAAFMADGYARAGRAPGVCLSIGGPGAANMLTAAQAAELDGSPVLFITGDVPGRLAGRGAFQDSGKSGTKDVALYERALAWSRAVRDRGELGDALAEAWEVLEAGRPAHLAIPVDVLCARAVADRRPVAGARHAPRVAVPERLVSVLRNASGILVMAGRRLATRAGAESLRRFAETHSLPVLTTLAAKGLLPENHPLALGNGGFAGSRRANEALLDRRYEVLLLVGADFNERDSLAFDERIARRRRIVRLDTARRPYDSPVAAELEYLDVDLVAWLDALARLAPGDLGGPREAPERGRAGAAEAVEEPPDTGSGGALDAKTVVETLRAVTPDEAALVVDGGMVRAFAGQGWQARQPLAFHSAASTAPTGWAIPAAVGVKQAEPGRDVVVLTGDGCMLMHGIEIATAARYRTALVVVVLDNGGHGSVLRRRPTRAMEDLVRTAEVDWPGFARSLGAEGVSVGDAGRLASEVRRGLAGAGPLLVHVRTSAHEPYVAAEHVFLSYSGDLQERE